MVTVKSVLYKNSSQTHSKESKVSFNAILELYKTFKYTKQFEQKQQISLKIGIFGYNLSKSLNFVRVFLA